MLQEMCWLPIRVMARVCWPVSNLIAELSPFECERGCGAREKTRMARDVVERSECGSTAGRAMCEA